MSSSKQKLDTWSSTEYELEAIDDCMPTTMWTRYFPEAQGYRVQENTVYQDNLNAMLLEQNGKFPTSKQEAKGGKVSGMDHGRPPQEVKEQVWTCLPDAKAVHMSVLELEIKGPVRSFSRKDRMNGSAGTCRAIHSRVVTSIE